MIELRTAQVKNVAACYAGTSVTIDLGDDWITIAGSAQDIQALGQSIIDASTESATPRDGGVVSMEWGPL